VVEGQLAFVLQAQPLGVDHVITEVSAHAVFFAS
jgi:hypothetical protein